MYQARKYLNRNGLISLYNSYIYPHLIYCVESWGNASVCHLDPLFVLQKNVRIMTYSNYDTPSRNIYIELNMLPLYNNNNNIIIIIITYSSIALISSSIRTCSVRCLDEHLIQNRIGFMMYKHVNGLLPEVMNTLYVTNNQIHNHFTRLIRTFKRLCKKFQ